jgi:hypothetical protein
MSLHPLNASSAQVLLSANPSLKRVAWAYGCAKKGSEEETMLRSALLAHPELPPGRISRGTFPGDLERQPSGHTRHCESRMEHGDGECECGVRRKETHAEARRALACLYLMVPEEVARDVAAKVNAALEAR